MKAEHRISEIARAGLRAEISESEGNEVFVLGFLDEDRLVSRYEVISRGHKSAVLALPARWEEADVLIHNHPSGNLTPSDNDLAIASRAADAGLGAYILDNDVHRVYIIAEAAKKRSRRSLDADKIVSALESGGAIARRLASFESRPAQLDLMRLVIRGFNEDALVAAEAGTGVGKSFAYLVPAMAFAALNDERIVLSTATITLQQQLYEKDIPTVAGALKKPVKAVLVKGRSNYLCLRRLEDALRERELFADDEDALEAITAWSETTQSGSRSELSFLPREALWTRVCSESDLCMGMRCPHRERCFIMFLKKDAASARILVVNHHLLFADLAARSEGAGYEGTVVLPPYSRLVLDEAHTVEDAATSFFSKDLGRLGIQRQLSRLYRKRRSGAVGLLPRVASLSGAAVALDDAVEALILVRERAEALDAAGLALAEGEGAYRFTEKKADRIEAVLLREFAELRRAIAKLSGSLFILLEGISGEDQDDPAVWEAKAVLTRLEGAAAVCGSFLEYRDRKTEVFWLELVRGASGNDPWVRFSITPVDVAPSLRDALLEPNKTVICVSATLTVADSFAYWSSRVGLSLMNSERPLFTGIFPSPFPYERAVLLAAPTDAPLPEEAGYREYVDRSVASLTELSGGSALVLFTSYEALNSAYAQSRPVLEALGVRCLRQGDDDRTRLLQEFLRDESSVLFATDSFWEGVDAPGDTLRLVILCRLPFRTPNEPVYEARREALEARGGNAFMELSLPESVMKLKQGFGRLMRRSDDHGVVVVLDGRLLRKRYGSMYLRSLPPARTCFTGFEQLLLETERFLYP